MKPDWRWPGNKLWVQQIIQRGVTRRTSIERFTRNQQIAIEINIGFIHAPPPRKAVRIQRMQKHTPHRRSRFPTRSPLLQQPKLHRRTKETLHAMQTA